jgi:hypothetical protein
VPESPGDPTRPQEEVSDLSHPSEVLNDDAHANQLNVLRVGVRTKYVREAVFETPPAYLKTRTRVSK